MLASLPLLIVPFIIYNLGLAGFFGSGINGDPWASEILSIGMMSGGVFSMTLGDLMVVIGLIFFFIEILKSTRTSNASVIDHLLSTFVFVAFLVEFLLVKGAAHSVFFTLIIITLIDVLAGFSVSIRAAGRDVNLN
ncbi:hypothetical protein ASD50_02280 [Mesorhizobium sp. Root552]|jgi:hypothetical protein|uniref:hypothetical protein n=1 Tax=Mesorhizobium sp. Root552 TaxID=1736555 RepID=UPI0006FBE589|nr:hypothetical protein [Mesorhizobium sp. Root552]KQZ29591.1 hypothetical protein ASD50_02280 [Mesorhizobium sp. Root552]